MLTDAIDETREQIARIDELLELTGEGFKNPGGHGLLDKFEWEDGDESI